MVEDLSALALEVGAAEGGRVDGAVLVEPEQVELADAVDEFLGFLEDDCLPALLEVAHEVCSFAGESAIELCDGSVAGEEVIDGVIHLRRAAAILSRSQVAVQPFQVIPAQLYPSPILSHIVIDLVELAHYHTLVLLQNLRFFLVQLVP